MKKTIVGILVVLLLGFAVASIHARTIWGCSNHKPAHTATSSQQMQDLTKRYACSGWHKL